MNNLLTPEEIKTYKDIGNKIDYIKIIPIIKQAQDVDFRDFLGIKFYFDILANLENETYQDLINGCSFIDESINYYQEGLKAMLADLFMARYVLQINLNLTPFGATTKTAQDSEPASENSLKNRAQMEREMASSKWEIIQLYLKVNQNLFPNNIAAGNTIASGERKLKFRKL